MFSVCILSLEVVEKKFSVLSFLFCLNKNFLFPFLLLHDYTFFFICRLHNTTQLGMSSDAMTSHSRVQSCPALPLAFRRNSREGNTRNLHSESSAFIDMVSSCSVKHCHNRQDRDRDRRFFSVPFVVNGKGKETRDLTARRGREWLAQLQLKNFNFESTARRYVCSDHFVNGKYSCFCSPALVSLCFMQAVL